MKKEDYFTLESIGKKARSMLSDIKELRKQHSLKLCPRRAGLLVIDMQRYFLEDALGCWLSICSATF